MLSDILSQDVLHVTAVRNSPRDRKKCIPSLAISILVPYLYPLRTCQCFPTCGVKSAGKSFGCWFYHKKIRRLCARLGLWTVETQVTCSTKKINLLSCPLLQTSCRLFLADSTEDGYSYKARSGPAHLTSLPRFSHFGPVARALLWSLMTLLRTFWLPQLLPWPM
jgi:hypothetical protein